MIGGHATATALPVRAGKEDREMERKKKEGRERERERERERDFLAAPRPTFQVRIPIS